MVLCNHEIQGPFLRICPVCGHEAHTDGPVKRECKPPIQQPTPARDLRNSHQTHDPHFREKSLLKVVSSCIHRGPILRENVVCTLCGGNGDLYPVYECKIYRECSLGKRANELHSCLSCSESTPAT